MKKRLALAAAFAFSIIPFTSFADHLEPDESEIKKGGELVSTKLEEYDLFSNNFSDDILIAMIINGYVIEPGRDLSGANLSLAYLRFADLRGADLSNALLIDADLRQADLRFANLTGADLEKADLEQADLSNANLFNALLIDADLSNADLSDVNLSNADLSGADLSNADLSGVIAQNLTSCPSALPADWVCEDNSLIEEVEEVVEEEVVEEEVVEEEVVEEEVVEEETAEAEDIDFDSITKADLPLKVYCPDRGADLIIREKKKKKGFVVKITRRRGERFFDGRKFRKAVKKFKKALENEC